MQYLFVIILLFAGMLLYFKIASKCNIIDKPNRRSSHDYITIRGGGIVFWLAALIYSVQYIVESRYFFAGMMLVCGVSFWDDISSLPNRVRITAHFLSISLIFYGLSLFTLFPWWLVVVAYVLFVGIMNAYNFMDGINGITGLYSLAVLIPLQYVNHRLISFTHPDFINYAILACVVFLFFNLRKRAKCFAGDIGSLGLSFWIITLLLQLMIATQSLIWIIFLAVYGIDAIYTILHRIYLKHNIFKAHRLHFYQILSNEKSMSHLTVSFGYALTQFLICAVMIVTYQLYAWTIGIIIIGILTIIYLLKFKIMKQNRASLLENNRIDYGKNQL
ncbi:MAG: glycosyltransferase family 4 protein [Bacteroidales bacterium]|jgi:UDP-N-acetylmuramyl pentapeptide phosphotransferase/UDP-N-acetylglucosamine-1-phosphate transferase|nr:glycosyltransferase family 4 protein [Bacteroidales bacterium]